MSDKIIALQQVCQLEKEFAEFKAENKRLKEKCLKHIARLLNRIHSDIFEKQPRGQVKKDDHIQWKRCLNLLAESDKARALIDELWDNQGDIFVLAEKE